MVMVEVFYNLSKEVNKSEENIKILLRLFLEKLYLKFSW